MALLDQVMMSHAQVAANAAAQAAASGDPRQAARLLAQARANIGNALAALGVNAHAAPSMATGRGTVRTYAHPGTPAQEAYVQATLNRLGEGTSIAVIRSAMNAQNRPLADSMARNPGLARSILQTWWFSLPAGARVATMRAAGGPAATVSLAPAVSGLGSYYETRET